LFDGDPARPLPRKGQSPPICCSCLLQPNGCMDQDATWYGGSPWPTRHCVKWGPSSTPLKGHSPQFSANVHCGRTAGWTKMPLGMEVGPCPGDFMFDGDPATPIEKGHTHPHSIFGPCLLWPNGWMDEDATCYGSRPRPSPHCVKWGSSCPQKGHNSPSLFGPCLLSPWSPISATAELLFVNIVHIYRVSIRVRVWVRVNVSST